MRAARQPKSVRAPVAHSLAMSVEAHVDYLIREATSLDNLSNCYSGWCASFARPHSLAVVASRRSASPRVPGRRGSDGCPRTRTARRDPTTRLTATSTHARTTQTQTTRSPGRSATASLTESVVVGAFAARRRRINRTSTLARPARRLIAAAKVVDARAARCVHARQSACGNRRSCGSCGQRAPLLG